MVSTHHETGWARLSLDLRMTIWELVYTTLEPRTVEVRTQEHAHYDHDHKWCPRFSPTPSPNLVNVCRESRSIAQHLAQRSGHLIFPTTYTSTSTTAATATAAHVQTSDIYFNPKIDTLYVRNEKEYWIRDWGPEGILTQFQDHHSPELLRHLAVELEPLSRKSSKLTVSIDLGYFSGLESYDFVVGERSEEADEWIRCLNRHLRTWDRPWRAAPGPSKIVPPHLRVCKLVRWSQGRLQELD